jgi:hypothetical protein
MFNVYQTVLTWVLPALFFLGAQSVVQISAPSSWAGELIIFFFALVLVGQFIAGLGHQVGVWVASDGCMGSIRWVYG